MLSVRFGDRLAIGSRENDTGRSCGDVNHCLDMFGPERVMFAVDRPVCTFGPASASGSRH